MVSAIRTQDELARDVIAAMRQLKYKVYDKPGERNMVALEGANSDGSPNDNAPDRYNDRRMVIDFVNGQPHMVLNQIGTTEPGKKYTFHRINSGGVARINFGQYDAWCVGIHHAGKASAHEAMVQTGGPVTVCRDDNEDFLREGDKLDPGYHGINWHGGYVHNESVPLNTDASAGCIVTPSMEHHKQFMTAMKADPRYVADRKFVFTGTILPVAALPAPSKTVVTDTTITRPVKPPQAGPGAVGTAGAVVGTGATGGVAVGVQQGWGLLQWSIFVLVIAAICTVGYFGWRWWQAHKVKDALPAVQVPDAVPPVEDRPPEPIATPLLDAAEQAVKDRQPPPTPPTQGGTA